MKRSAFLVLVSLAILVTFGILVQRLLHYRAAYHRNRAVLGTAFQSLLTKYRALEATCQAPWENRNIPMLAEIADDIRKQHHANVHETILAVRKYVREASADHYDDWYHKYNRDLPVVMATLYQRHHDPTHSRLASLDCYPSCLAASCILNYLGLTIRHVAFYSDDYENIVSHACLEVYNPETKGWELHDVLWDLHYVDKQSGRVVDAATLVFGDLDKIVPTDGRNTGWEKGSPRRDATLLRDHYFEVLAYNSPMPRCFVLINTDRASPTKVFPKRQGLTLVQCLDQILICPTILSVQGGSFQPRPPLLKQLDVATAGPREARPVR